MPRVSVVIPAYNVEAFIEESVRSALAQSFRDFEVIVVNDGSTDGTAEVLERFGNQILHLEQANKGPAAARNAALERAQGEYVALLDGDDVWVPQRLERMVAYLDAHKGTTLVTTDAYLIEPGETKSSTYYLSRPKRLRFREEAQPYWIAQYNFILGFVLCRREAFDEHGNFDHMLQAFADWELWLRFIASGAKASFIDQPLGFYRIRRDSLTANQIEIMSEEISVLERALARPTSAGIPGLRGRLSFANAKRYLADQDWKAAREHFCLAAADSQLPGATRRRAKTAAVLPHLAWNVYWRQLHQRSK